MGSGQTFPPAQCGLGCTPSGDMPPGSVTASKVMPARLT